mmetsp:Transcript_42344/g.75879  ORF Transcript_42344/g.75879 Transcript_42344/m.75879 type:complete len:240 (-) Transcript_42344:501-1220(-)
MSWLGGELPEGSVRARGLPHALYCCRRSTDRTDRGLPTDPPMCLLYASSRVGMVWRIGWSLPSTQWNPNLRYSATSSGALLPDRMHNSPWKLASCSCLRTSSPDIKHPGKSKWWSRMTMSTSGRVSSKKSSTSSAPLLPYTRTMGFPGCASREACMTARATWESSRQFIRIPGGNGCTAGSACGRPASVPASIGWHGMRASKVTRPSRCSRVTWAPAALAARMMCCMPMPSEVQELPGW